MTRTDLLKTIAAAARREHLRAYHPALCDICDSFKALDALDAYTKRRDDAKVQRKQAKPKSAQQG